MSLEGTVNRDKEDGRLGLVTSMEFVWKAVRMALGAEGWGS